MRSRKPAGVAAVDKAQLRAASTRWGGQIVRCTRRGGCYTKNPESHAFPKAFLNHLETAAPYPDSSGLLDWGQTQKSVYKQRLS
jgi:hypothetical protein